MIKHVMEINGKNILSGTLKPPLLMQVFQRLLLTAWKINALTMDIQATRRLSGEAVNAVAHREGSPQTQQLPCC